MLLRCGLRTTRETADPIEYVRLRERAEFGVRTEAAAKRGLENGTYAVTIRRDDDLVGMGRLVGDDGCFYKLVDIAVAPDHQDQGLGTRIVEALVEYVEKNAPPSAYVSLVSNVDGFYERFGFEAIDLDQTGMYRGCNRSAHVT
jgi:GNAT superfamily N-acetyltransferase